MDDPCRPKAAVVARAMGGDLDAFELLFRSCQRRVFLYVYRLLSGRRQDAEDATQQAFANALAKIQSLRQPGGFRVWLFRIAGNCAKDVWRKLEKELPRNPDVDPDDVPTPSAESRRQRRIDLEKALNDLPWEQRQAFLLRYEHGMTIDQIADIQRSRPGTVQYRIQAATEKLRRRLE